MQLRCKAPHPNPSAGRCCDYPQASSPLGWKVEFVGFVERMPEKEDEYLYVACKRKHCKAVSVYKVTAVNQVA